MSVLSFGNMNYTRLMILFKIYLMTACIDPFDIRIPIYEKQMVVDGTLYEGTGPHHIKLYYSLNLQTEDEFINPSPVDDAVVSIITSHAGEINFMKQSSGLYEIPEGQLEVLPKEFYQLKIVRNGNTYYSSTQLLEDSGDIDDLYFEFAKEYFFNARDGVFEDAFLIYINASAGENSNGLLRWRYTGIYEIITQPELRVAPGPMGIRVPDPNPCSGYFTFPFNASYPPEMILETQYGPIVRLSDCICCSCWVYESDGKSKVSRTNLVSEKQFNKVLIAQIPIDRWRFYRKYHVRVEQLSISEDVYEFWKRVESQQSGAGSLFQPNAIIIEGNIVNQNNPDDRVLGIFSVSSIKSKDITIPRTLLPYTLQPPPEFWEDCRLRFRRSSNERPIFW